MPERFAGIKCSAIPYRKFYPGEPNAESGECGSDATHAVEVPGLGLLPCCWNHWAVAVNQPRPQTYYPDQVLSVHDAAAFALSER